MREILLRAGSLVGNSQHVINKSSAKLIDIINNSPSKDQKVIPISLELLPDRSLDFEVLAKLRPRFCAVTWLEKSVDDLKQILALDLTDRLQESGHNVLLHLAGRNLKKEQVLGILQRVKDSGGRNIFALQGDPSRVIQLDDAKCDFPYAVDLVRFIRANFGDYFCIAVAGYPENHPKSKNTHEEMVFLKQKVSSGADLILTQASFDIDAILDFARNCRKYSIDVPIIAGLFIITSYKSLLSVSQFCSVSVPEAVLSRVRSKRHDPVVLRDFGVSWASDMIKRLLEETDLIRGVHIFTMNNLDAVGKILNKFEMGS